MTAVCFGARRSRRRRAILTALVLAGVVIVALLALYSYAHTFTDVLGGMALGGAIVAAGAALWASIGAAEAGAAQARSEARTPCRTSAESGVRGRVVVRVEIAPTVLTALCSISAARNSGSGFPYDMRNGTSGLRRWLPLIVNV